MKVFICGVDGYIPTWELSYLIGVIFGDGSVFSIKRMDRPNPSYRIQLTVKDLDFVKEFNRCLCKVLNKKPYSIQIDRKKYYRIIGYSKSLVEFLQQPLINLKPTIKEFPDAFIKGFFDSDGYVDNKSRNGTQTIIGFTNTNKELLNYIQKILSDFFDIYSKM